MDHNYSFQRRVFKCSYCNLQFKYRKHLLFHEKHKHNVFTKKVYKCDHCHIHFNYINNLKDHEAEIHNIKPITFRPSLNRSLIYFKCNHCSIHFKKKLNLLWHERHYHYVKHVKKEFKCEYCESRFISLKCLEAHKAAKHIMKPTSKDRIKLRSHDVGLHVIKKDFKCGQCHSQFNYLKKLRAHEVKKHIMSTPALKKKFNCEFCSSQFNYLKNVRAHEAKKHSVSSPTSNYNAKCDVMKKFNCDHCSSKFKDLKNLRAHETKKHSGMIVQDYDENHVVKEKYICEYCGTQLNTLKELKVHEAENHIVKIKTNYNNYNRKKLYPCEHCGSQFNYLKNLRSHERKKHNIEPTKPKPIQSFECSECNAKYSRKNHLQSHVKKKHREDQLNVLFFNCSICSHAAPKAELLLHFIDAHGIEINIHKQIFNSFVEFEEWKRKEEKESLSSFTTDRCQQKISASGEKIFYAYYSCHRSGYYTPRGNSLKRLKAQGSKKIGGYCPANMKIVTSESGLCKLEYTKTHVGHDNDLCHLFLNKEDKDILASQIAVKKPFEEILKDVKNSVPESERLHFVSKKDLQNINQSFKVSSELLDESDKIRVVDVDVSLLFNDISDGNDCIQFYKPQGVEEEICEYSSTEMAFSCVEVYDENNSNVNPLLESEISDYSIQFDKSQEVKEETYKDSTTNGSFDMILENDISDHNIQFDKPQEDTCEGSTTASFHISTEKLDEYKHNFLELIESISTTEEMNAIDSIYKMAKRKINAIRSCNNHSIKYCI